MGTNGRKSIGVTPNCMMTIDASHQEERLPGSGCISWRVWLKSWVGKMAGVAGGVVM